MTLSFDNRHGWIWLNGSFVPWKDATSHVITQGLHYASTVFEGERAYNGKIFKSKEHTERLFKSAEIMGIEIPFSHEEINIANMFCILTGRCSISFRLININYSATPGSGNYRGRPGYPQNPRDP